MAKKPGTYKRGQKGYRRCKQPTKSGHRCKFRAQESGYCTRHEAEHYPDGWVSPPDGERPDPPRVEQSVPTVPHEFYADAYTADELATMSRADMEASTLDAEIRLLRTQLRRVSKQIRQVETGDSDYDPLRIFSSEQEIDDVAVGPDGQPLGALPSEDGKKPKKGASPAQTGTLKRRTSRRAPDLYARQDTLMRRLERYIRLRAELQNQGTGGSDPGELAREMRDEFHRLGEMAAGGNPSKE